MNGPDIRRRAVLAGICGGSLGVLTGVAGGTGDTSVRTSGSQQQISSTSRQDITEENTIFVDPSGRNDNPGTTDSPVGTIQEALERVEPGERVYANSGEYQEFVVPDQGGTPENPVELTGPPDAVLRRPPDSPAAIAIVVNHFHLTGLSIDGLADPDRPEDPDAYGDGPVVHMTAPDLDEYVEGIVIAPHGIGNSGRQLVNMNFAKNIEVGPFEVIGRAGAKWQLTDEENHNGEIVYVGSARSSLEQVDEFEGWDRTRDIHIHHIDNSAGHPHSQLVDIKAGAEDVTIEYCTDGGGSQNDQDWTATSVKLAGYDCTLRWCLIQDGEDDAVNVGTEISEDSPDDEVAEQVGTENAIYGNEISGFEDGWGLGFYPGSDAGQGPEHQAIICGNNIEGRVAGDPESDCPEDVPTGEGIGHTGGDPEAAQAAISDFEPLDMESPDQSSSADLLLYAATCLATASMFVPYSVRRFRRRSK